MSSGMPPSRLERKLTIKAKELKDALQSCHTLKGESVSMKKSLEEVQTALEQKEKALRNAEYERDLLEKEKVLYDTQVKVRTTEEWLHLFKRYQQVLTVIASQYQVLDLLEM